MKSGFTLIELSIGLLLSGIIATALYNGFFVTHRVVDISDNFITTDFRSALIENQFGKDLEGVFVPEDPELSKTTTTQKEVTEKKESTTKTTKETKVVEEKTIKPLEKVFYSINGAQDSLSVLTFITNNPVKVYEKATNVKPKSRIVRVAYRLQPEENNPKAFSLIRQESSELDFKAFDPKSAKPIRGYELASGIKNIKLDYIFPVQKEQPTEQSKGSAPAEKSKAAPQKKEEKPKPEYKTVKDWDLESKKDTTQEQTKIPQFITITCELWDTKQQRESSFTFKYEIPTFAYNILPKKPKKSPAPKEAKTETTETPQAATPVNTTPTPVTERPVTPPAGG